jgi:hypothetical protein
MFLTTIDMPRQESAHSSSLVFDQWELGLHCLTGKILYAAPVPAGELSPSSTLRKFLEEELQPGEMIFTSEGFLDSEGTTHSWISPEYFLDADQELQIDGAELDGGFLLRKTAEVREGYRLGVEKLKGRLAEWRVCHSPWQGDAAGHRLAVSVALRLSNLPLLDLPPKFS